MPDAARIVVATPVRNEAWILDRFLAVTSRVAERIVIADQQSTDESREICRRYPKVTLLENPSTEFNEAARQVLLLDAARAEVPLPRIILALDADEVLAADAPGSAGWARLRALPPGTVIGVERVDLLDRGDLCLRHGRRTALGYVDDGAPHRPRAIHSRRIPSPEGASLVELPDVQVLHYARLRPSAVAAKARWYSALENCLGTCPWALKRRARYHEMMNPSGRAWTEPSRPSWFEGWEALGIDMRSAREERFYWYDDEVLRLFQRWGARRFWLDNLWDVDWEECRRAALARGEAGIPVTPVRAPPWPLRRAMRVIDPLYRRQRALRHRLTRRWGPAA
jgi:glycosyltransferase involved in cell wall biosynthesis